MVEYRCVFGVSLLYALCGNICVVLSGEAEADILMLTENFFANLQETPELLAKTLNDTTKLFIDRQIENYKQLVKKAHGLDSHSLARRSLPIDDIATLIKDDVGVYSLKGITAVASIHAVFPKDVAIFIHKRLDKETWYAAALECRDRKQANDLVIYKHIEGHFREAIRVQISNGVKLDVHTLQNATFIVVAEKTGPKEEFGKKTGIYAFSFNETLTKIQTLDLNYASDVAMWKDGKQLFMAISVESMEADNGEIVYEVNTPIYKWLGQHFDIVQHIRTYGARRVTPFIIGNSHFLAVANFRNNYGNSNIYSEIFKYDLHTDRFILHQRILTNAATDTKHFSFKRGHIQESFFIVANSFQTEINGDKNEETNSIVYKYVDEYFIPFQTFKLTAAHQWLPYQGPNGEFLLLASTKYEGVKIFQYDGWKFIESKVQYTDGSFSAGVNSMRTFKPSTNESLIIVANSHDDGNWAKVFKPEFTFENQLKSFQDHIFGWCQKELNNVNNDDSFKSRSAKAARADDVLRIPQQNLSAENLHNFEIRDKGEDETESDLSDAIRRLNSYSRQLDAFKSSIRNPFEVPGNFTFHGNVDVKNLILNNTSVTFNNPSIETINAINVEDVFANVININEGLDIETLHIDDIKLEHLFNPSFINSQQFDKLVFKNSNTNFDNLRINGNVTFINGVVVDGRLDGVTYNKRTVLLNTGKQEFKNLQTSSVICDELNATNINNIDILAANEPLLTNINSLSATNITLSGLLNKVDLPTLNKYALRTFGTQKISGRYHFDRLQLDYLNTKRVSGVRIPDDLVEIHGKSYSIKNLNFEDNFEVRELKVTSSLNAIKVDKKGQLDVLLLDSPAEQHITGYKEIDNLTLLNPVLMQSGIQGKLLHDMNPVKILDNEFIIEQDVTIIGDVNSKGIFRAQDIVSSSGEHSVRKLFEEGVMINETYIPVHINFSQAINVQDIFADRINNAEVSSLVVTNANEPQVITGWKQFVNDLHVTGKTSVSIINGIDIENLNSNVLKTSGQQTIAGAHSFKRIVANRINNVKTRFGSHMWSDVLTRQDDQQIAGTTVISNKTEVTNLSANHLVTNGKVNGYNFNKMAADTAFIGQTYHIKGFKQFAGMAVENLTAVHGLNLELMSDKIINDGLVFNQDVELPNNISVENILFNGDLNGVPRTNFRSLLIAENGSDIVGTQRFGKIVILGNAYIEDGQINNQIVQDMVDNAVKIDEITSFNSFTFEKGVQSLTNISTAKVDTLDLNDVVQNASLVEQIIVDKMTFNSTVEIFGAAYFNGLISGLNLGEFCSFASPENGKKLIVNGAAHFIRGPRVNFVNGISIPHMTKNAWFTNRETFVTGSMSFDHIFFNEDVTVEDFVDGVKLQLLAQTYFSKTKNQTISARFDFSNGAAFESDLIALEATVENMVNNINLNEFVSKAILDEEDQVFEDIVDMEECEIRESTGTYTVNGLNLETDVMRYDVDNIVTGEKTITNVGAHKLSTQPHLKIQDVQILPWIQNSVLKDVTMRITGKTVFHEQVTFASGIGCQKFVNGIMFTKDNVMLKSIPQNITGQKTFSSLSGETATTFKTLKLRGLLNDIDIAQLLYDQAYKTGNSVFESPIIFNQEVTANEVTFHKLYRGVHVSQLIHNITHLSNSEDYYYNYENLLNMSYGVQDSLRSQAYYLDHYEVRQIYKNNDFVVPLFGAETGAPFLGYTTKNEAGNYTMEFAAWDSEKQHFAPTDMSPVHFHHNLKYMQPLTFEDKEYVYVENMDDYNKHGFEPFLYVSFIYEMFENGSFSTAHALQHNGTQAVFSLPQVNGSLPCILAQYSDTLDVYCVEGFQMRFKQRIELHRIVEATSAVVQQTLYMFVAREEGRYEDRVEIWKFNRDLGIFETDQVMFVAGPKSISASFYRGEHYLAIASGHLNNAMHPGIIEIRKFNVYSRQFDHFQDINVDAPVHLEFVELPTTELVLYVTTENPAKPLIVMFFEGISRFTEKIVGSTIPNIKGVKFMTTANGEHIIIAESAHETRIIQAVFTGNDGF